MAFLTDALYFFVEHLPGQIPTLKIRIHGEMQGRADAERRVIRRGRRRSFSNNVHRPMSSVAKSIELLAEGDTLEDATEAAVEEASKTIANIQSVYVDNYRAVIEDGEIEAYRVHATITFVLEDEGVE